MIRLCLLALLFFSCSLQLSAQEKLVLAGSGNPAVMIVDKQSGTVEWKHALEKGEECNTVAVTRQGNILYSYKKGAKLICLTYNCFGVFSRLAYLASGAATQPCP